MRRIAGVKIIDKRRMKEFREEVGVKESFTRELVRSLIRWAGHVENMEGVRRKRMRLEWMIEGEEEDRN